MPTVKKLSSTYRRTGPRKHSTYRRTGPRKHSTYRRTKGEGGGRLDQMFDIRHGLILQYLGRPEGTAMGTVDPVGKELSTLVRKWDWPKPYKFGTKGSEEGQFAHPCGVAISSGGDIVVCDAGSNNCIQVFKPKGKFLRRWGNDNDNDINSKDDGQFDGPSSVAVSSTDEVFVADMWNHRIQVFRLDDGEFLRSFGDEGTSQGQFDKPTSVAIHKKEVFVCDSANNRIQVFDLKGEFKRTWSGTSAQEMDKLVLPVGLAVSAEGEVFVCDSSNRILVFNIDGTFVRKFGGMGFNEGKFMNPTYIAVSATGIVLVSDNTRVQVFLADGTFLRLMNLPAPPLNSMGGMPMTGMAMAVTSDDSVIICDTTRNVIHVLPNGIW